MKSYTKSLYIHVLWGARLGIQVIHHPCQTYMLEFQDFHIHIQHINGWQLRADLAFGMITLGQTDRRRRDSKEKQEEATFHQQLTIKAIYLSGHRPLLTMLRRYCKERGYLLFRSRNFELYKVAISAVLAPETVRPC